ncbi:MAG: NYN domain-containing protein, partial [Lentisphaerae bacterium]
LSSIPFWLVCKKQVRFPAFVNGSMEALNKLGRFTVKKAYADWGKLAPYRQSFIQSGFEMIEVPALVKNKPSSPVKFALDVLECAIMNPEIQIFVVVSLRNELLALIQKLQQLKRITVVLGISRAANSLLAKNCDRFLAIDKIIQNQTQTRNKEVPKEVVELMEKVLVERKNKNQDMLEMGSVKNLMRQENPAFDERLLGFESFSEFVNFVEANKLLPIRKERRNNTKYIIFKTRNEHPEWENREMTEEEWETFLEAVSTCIREGEGNPNQGKLWIINAYLHKRRLNGELQLANEVFANAIKQLTEAGVLLHPSKDIYLLPENFEERKEEFLDELFGVEVIEEFYEEEVEDEVAEENAESSPEEEKVAGGSDEAEG